MKHRPTIVIAENQHAEQAHLERVAQRMGLEVAASVSSGTRLLAACVQHQPDLIVSEIRLKRLDGLSAYKQARRRGVHAHAVFLTESPEPGLLLESFELGSVECLAKPVACTRIEGALRRALRRLAEQRLYQTADQQTERWIACRHRHRPVVLAERTIVSAERIARKTRIYLTDGRTLETTLTLKELLLQGSGSLFSPHRSCFVNLNYVCSVADDPLTARNYVIRLSHDREVPLARRKYPSFRERMSLLFGHMPADPLPLL